MSRLLNIILSLLLFSAAVFSCEKAKKDAPVNSDDRMLSFDRERVEVPCMENRFSLRVSANFDYAVGFDVDWIREDKTNSYGEEYIFPSRQAIIDIIQNGGKEA